MAFSNAQGVIREELLVRLEAMKDAGIAVDALYEKAVADIKARCERCRKLEEDESEKPIAVKIVIG